MFTSIEFVAYFHVHIEEWKGRDDVVLEEKATFTLCLQGKTLGNAEWSVACILVQDYKPQMTYFLGAKRVQNNYR